MVNNVAVRLHYAFLLDYEEGKWKNSVKVQYAGCEASGQTLTLFFYLPKIRKGERYVSLYWKRNRVPELVWGAKAEPGSGNHLGSQSGTGFRKSSGEPKRNRVPEIIWGAKAEPGSRNHLESRKRNRVPEIIWGAKAEPGSGNHLGSQSGTGFQKSSGEPKRNRVPRIFPPNPPNPFRTTQRGELTLISLRL